MSRPLCPALLAGAVGLIVLLLLSAPAYPADESPPYVSAYHADAARSGHYAVPGLTWAAANHLMLDSEFDGRVPGHVYAQPLFWRNPDSGQKLVVVATEDDIVVALDTASGKPVWQTKVGSPVPAKALPCSNIDPLGITGTPVIDPITGSVFFDAVVDGAHGPRHEVFGLRLSDGAILPGWPLDIGVAMAGRGLRFVPRDQNQRAALAWFDGRIYVGFGGHAGDCGQYHGVMLGITEVSPHIAAAWMTRGRKGGVWSPGGVSIIAGRIYFTTGNTERGPTDGWDDGNGVFRTMPVLVHSEDAHDYFAPRDYAALSDDDLDLGGTVPVPVDLPDGAHRLIALGKDGNAYLLDRDNLGGLGGALAVQRVASGAIIQAPVVYRLADDILVAFRAPRAACPDGRTPTAVIAVAVTATGLHPVWCAPVKGRGIPIVTTNGPQAEPIVWVAGAEGDERLHGFRGDTGVSVFASEPLPGLRHFVTPMAADGRIFLAGDGRVVAFRWNPAN